MITRREVLQIGAATAALTTGGGDFTRAMAQQRLSEAELLKFEALGNVTLLHVADIHGQLMPVYFREPSINLGVGAARGQPPHLTGGDFLKRYIRDPQSLRHWPQAKMPAFAPAVLPDGELDQLVAYLKHMAKRKQPI